MKNKGKLPVKEQTLIIVVAIIAFSVLASVFIISSGFKTEPTTTTTITTALSEVECRSKAIVWCTACKNANPRGTPWTESDSLPSSELTECAGTYFPGIKTSCSGADGWCSAFIPVTTTSLTTTTTTLTDMSKIYWVPCSPCFTYFAFVDYVNGILRVRNGPRTIMISSVTGGTTTDCTASSCTSGNDIVITGLKTGDVQIEIVYIDIDSGLTHTDTATLHSRPEYCSNAQFRLYSGSYDKNTKELILILENQRSVDLQLKNIYFVYSNLISKSKTIDETLEGNRLRSIKITGVDDNFMEGVIETDCPGVYVEFDYSDVI